MYPTSPDYCKELIYSGSFPPHQCSRKPKQDGYCAQHHPDVVKARRDARNAKWDAERKAAEDRSHTDPTQLRAAINEIMDLVVQLPSGIDQDADPTDTSPADMVAHVGGLIWQVCQKVRTEA